jgi:hypothetical protein
MKQKSPLLPLQGKLKKNMAALSAARAVTAGYLFE